MMILALLLLALALAAALLLWREWRLDQRRQVEVIRQRAHLKIVQFHKTHVERTQLMNRSDLL